MEDPNNKAINSQPESQKIETTTSHNDYHYKHKRKKTAHIFKIY